MNWITDDEAVRASRRGLTTDRDPAVGRVLRDAVPGDPLLVQRLDMPGAAYFLVPWTIGDRPVLMVQVDASSGTPLGIAVHADTTRALFLKPEEAMLRMGLEFPRHEFDRPRLVWRPCQESTTPFYPFYEVHLDRGDVYIRVDGTIFRGLTDLGRGG